MGNTSERHGLDSMNSLLFGHSAGGDYAKYGSAEHS